MGQTDFLTRLSAAIETDALCAPGERIVVGVSGGPDSMALLHALVELAVTRGTGWKLHIAHLNHRLRGEESDRDAEFVEEAARRLDLPCTLAASKAARTGSRTTSGLEESTRKERYEFLGQVCVQYGARTVAVGHHADDNAETILHHVVRGTGLRGLRGMLVKRELRGGSAIQLVRPLLGFRRAELLAFLNDRRIPYCLDRTNLEPTCTRNRIRHRVLPLIREEVNPQVVKALLRLGEQARWTESFLCETGKRLLESAVSSRDEWTLVFSRQGLLGRPRIVQSEVVRLAHRSFGLGERDLSFAHLRSVCELIGSDAAHGCVQLPGGLTVRRQYDRLIFSHCRDDHEDASYPEVVLAVPGTAALPLESGRIEARIEPFDAARTPHWDRAHRPGEEWLDYDCVSPPLVVRGARPGDRFRPLGAPGDKKLSDFFIDQKIPSRERTRTPILCDRDGPLWIIPYRIDERAKVTDRTTRLLRVVART